MPEIKFSCPQCSQHISCDEAWGGHTLECPACHTQIVVPKAVASPPPPATPPPVPGMPRQRSQPVGAKLAAGVTQVARPTAHAPVPTRRPIPRAPRGDNPFIKYGIMGVVGLALFWAGYTFVLPAIKDALPQDSGTSQPAGSQTSSGGGAVGGGPLGEMNAAMDISDALDGGSSAKPRPRPATNNPAQPATTQRR